MHMQRCIFETYITWFCFADALLYKAFMMSVRRYRAEVVMTFTPTDVMRFKEEMVIKSLISI